MDYNFIIGAIALIILAVMVTYAFNKVTPIEKKTENK